MEKYETIYRKIASTLSFHHCINACVEGLLSDKNKWNIDVENTRYKQDIDQLEKVSKHRSSLPTCNLLIFPSFQKNVLRLDIYISLIKKGHKLFYQFNIQYSSL